MLNEIILQRFKELKTKPAGKREISSLSDVDNGFTANLLQAFDGLQFVEPRREARPTVEFLKRSAADKISFGNYPDVGAFLSAQRASGAGQKDTQKTKPLNRLALPLVNVSREISYSFYVGERERDEHFYGDLFDEDDQLIAIVSNTPVQLDYKVWVVAADRETLSYMTAAIGTWIRLWQSRAATSFDITTSLCGMAVDITGALDAPKDVNWSDISLPQGDDRVYAAEMVVSVISSQLVAHLVDTYVIRHEVSLGIEDGH